MEPQSTAEYTLKETKPNFKKFFGPDRTVLGAVGLESTFNITMPDDLMQQKKNYYKKNSELCWEVLPHSFYSPDIIRSRMVSTTNYLGHLNIFKEKKNLQL